MDRLWSDESLRGPVRSKSEWAGISMADAFKDLDFGLRLVAQRLFFDTAHKIQRTVARLAGVRVDAGFKSAVPVQVSPSHTTYPPTVAVFASLGLTAFLELEARVKPKLLVTELASYLGSPGRFDRATSDPAIYAKVAKIVAETVQTRLLIEDLSRHRHLGTVEVYRLFAASQQAREFRTLGDIVRAVVLYSDLWGGREPEEMHRMTRRIYEDLDRTSTPYLARLASSQSDAFSRVGQGWVKALCRCLDKYLPLPRPAEPPHQEPRSAPEQLREWLDSFKFGRPDEKPPGPPPETIPPLDKPAPPALFEPPGAPERIAQALAEPQEPPPDERLAAPPPLADAGPDEVPPALKQALGNLKAALDSAVAPASRFEEARVDLVEDALRDAPFKRGPVEGLPLQGHEVTIGGRDGLHGGIFDRPTPLSNDAAAVDALRRESKPVADALRKILYPHVQVMLDVDRYRTSGAIDPARLALSSFSSTIFRRMHPETAADRRGRPVLLIAADFSESLKSDQIALLKVLAAGWLDASATTRVQVMAGVYHSGSVRPGLDAPVVEWLYHPRKTATVGRREAVRGLAALPASGTGIQSDALSLTFMLDEARGVARGRGIYVVLLTDCKWNKSFQGSRSGEDEMQIALKAARAKEEGPLHVTLVALAVDAKTGLENAVDKVIAVPAPELQNYARVAERIGTYVASCVRERLAAVGGAKR